MCIFSAAGHISLNAKLGVLCRWIDWLLLRSKHVRRSPAQHIVYMLSDLALNRGSRGDTVINRTYSYYFMLVQPLQTPGIGLHVDKQTNKYR